MTPYEQNQAFGGVIDVLEALGIKYAIWGGLAVVAHGEPRFTQDMDVLLQPHGFPVELFVRRLRDLHYHIDEAAVRNSLGGGYFNVIHLHYHIKTDFYVPEEPALLAMIGERIHLPFDEARRAAYVSPTALVSAKLRAYRDSHSTRHLQDIASVVRIQGQALDQTHLDRAAANLGLLGVWRRLWNENRGG